MSNQIESVDICCGLSYGDEGKGKIVAYLSKTKQYDFVCRWNGGHNAGHTIYKDGVKYKTHLIPSGIFYGIKSVIGPNCVVNQKFFEKEVSYLHKNGFDTTLIRISPKCTLITDEHLDLDKSTHLKQESTSTGIAPAYSDKYGRIAKQVKDVPYFIPYLFDEKLYGSILCEGAQGFWLDINQGNYPHTTSSHTLPYDACSIGFSPKLIRNIYGACKIYDTRSGYDPDFPDSLFDDKDLNELSLVGEEYGTTTGRRRKVDWLNLDKLIYSVNVSGTNVLYMSKVDIIQKLGIYKLYYNNTLHNFLDYDKMIKFIEDILNDRCKLDEITFSGNKEGI